MTSMERPGSIFGEVTPKVLADARALLAGARHATLATLSPRDGWPQATRVGLATREDGTPLIFVSGLAAHTPALLADPRCSLLIGEVGKGDPLAHARLMLKCRAKPVSRDDPAFASALGRYLAIHPKAKLYAQLPDFLFFRLKPESASYNAGFGQAFQMDGTRLIPA